MLNVKMWLVNFSFILRFISWHLEIFKWRILAYHNIITLVGIIPDRTHPVSLFPWTERIFM